MAENIQLNFDLPISTFPIKLTVIQSLISCLNRLKNLSLDEFQIIKSNDSLSYFARGIYEYLRNSSFTKSDQITF